MTDSAHVHDISAIFEILLSFIPFNISCLTNAMMSGQTNFVNTNISLFLFTTMCLLKGEEAITGHRCHKDIIAF